MAVLMNFCCCSKDTLRVSGVHVDNCWVLPPVCRLDADKHARKVLEKDLEDLKKIMEDTKLNQENTKREIEMVKDELEHLQKEHKDVRLETNTYTLTHFNMS